MKRTYRRGIVSNNTVRFGGNNKSGSTNNKVFIKGEIIKLSKIQYCKKCNARCSCDGIIYDLNNYGDNYKVSSKRKKINTTDIVIDYK